MYTDRLIQNIRHCLARHSTTPPALKYSQPVNCSTVSFPQQPIEFRRFQRQQKERGGGGSGPLPWRAEGNPHEAFSGKLSERKNERVSRAQREGIRVWRDGDEKATEEEHVCVCASYPQLDPSGFCVSRWPVVVLWGRHWRHTQSFHYSRDHTIYQLAQPITN